MAQDGERARGVGEARYTVRSGRREDSTAAARLWTSSVEEHARYDHVYSAAPDAEKVMRRFLADLSSSSHSSLFIAESGGEIIGFLSGELREGSPAFSSKTWAAVEDVYVVPELRSHGIGRDLFEAFQEWAHQKGATGVSLQVAAGNRRARGFYERLGFREVSVYEVKEF